ncbi:MAG: nucleotide exchange factor GrpE [Magnetococcales bacterium]|uniref:Protein GrpE n=1 Tax=Candidatus Magnetobacterium casense TaxID=1455061 RepID=A0ABS6RVD6_9BACT|nr:nucleotide exchange factor GrpE [Candidatus Magnetobacterium casensis]MBF0607471.1 nucleotide exchange factor GrpE [Nitrospirota bacterium]MBV6340591.1 nucleotide exchange factor GrpE [Candidatus Magnetobacterium casensis]
MDEHNINEQQRDNVQGDNAVTPPEVVDVVVVEQGQPEGQPDTAELEKIKEQMAETKDKYMRLYAEFDNYKKRVQREKEDILKYGMEPLVGDLLPVIDNLEAALSHASNSTAASLSTGVELTLKEFKKALSRYGVVEIEAKGKPFDPAFHEAMAETENNNVDDRTVLEEFRKGYMFKERVLRASLVKVSKKA